MDWYLRASSVVAVARGSSYLFTRLDRPPVVLDDIDVDAMSSVLDACTFPISHEALLELCGNSSIETLVELGVLIRGTEASLVEPARVPTKRCRHVTCILSGAVGVIRAVDHVTAVADRFADEVDVVITDGATHFIRPEVFEYYGLRTWLDAFTPQHGAPVPHEHLAARTDLVLVAPASANMLHRLASGACSDLASLIVAATKAPVVVAPAMNWKMWESPAVARNVAQLRADGIWVVEPRAGFEVSKRDQRGVGGLGFDRIGVLQLLDAILAEGSVAK